ncbi:MAG: cell division protein FtsA [Gammaproteobacteria bacterium]|jgi:cell division protein FtsA|nr:cell division protein FtsA [Gammaproteobacteria bacterium]
MTRKHDKSMVVGLDVGTAKVAAIVGERHADGEIEVIGVGRQPSRGLKRGVVVDIEATEYAIQRAIEEAELMADCQIQSVFSDISGSHIRSMNSHGIVAIKDKEVTESDVERVLDAARAVAVPADQRILHVLPQEYVIDKQDGIRQPVGMSGVRLEAHVHVVTAAQSAVQNLSKCIARCGLQVDGLILQPLASSHAMLTDDDKDLGIALLDIGAGTTDIAVFVHGAIRHTACIPIAGDQITNDIAVALRTPTQHAEELKIRYGCALEMLTSGDESIQVPGVGDRAAQRLARKTLAQVIEARSREIFQLVQAELQRSGYEHSIRAGIVITGGASQLEGTVELAEEVFHMPVRLGSVQKVTGLSEVIGKQTYAAAIGMLLQGGQYAGRAMQRSYGQNSGGILQRLKSWYQGEF